MKEWPLIHQPHVARLLVGRWKNRKDIRKSLNSLFRGSNKIDFLHRFSRLFPNLHDLDMDFVNYKTPFSSCQGYRIRENIGNFDLFAPSRIPLNPSLKCLVLEFTECELFLEDVVFPNVSYLCLVSVSRQPQLEPKESILRPELVTRSLFVDWSCFPKLERLRLDGWDLDNSLFQMGKSQKEQISEIWLSSVTFSSSPLTLEENDFPKLKKLHLGTFTSVTEIEALKLPSLELLILTASNKVGFNRFSLELPYHDGTVNFVNHPFTGSMWCPTTTFSGLKNLRDITIGVLSGHSPHPFPTDPPLIIENLPNLRSVAAQGFTHTIIFRSTPSIKVIKNMNTGSPFDFEKIEDASNVRRIIISGGYMSKRMAENISKLKNLEVFKSTRIGYNEKTLIKGYKIQGLPKLREFRCGRYSGSVELIKDCPNLTNLSFCASDAFQGVYGCSKRMELFSVSQPIGCNEKWDVESVLHQVYTSTRFIKRLVFLPGKGEENFSGYKILNRARDVEVQPTGTVILRGDSRLKTMKKLRTLKLNASKIYLRDLPFVRRIEIDTRLRGINFRGEVTKNIEEKDRHLVFCLRNCPCVEYLRIRLVTGVGKWKCENEEQRVPRNIHHLATPLITIRKLKSIRMIHFSCAFPSHCLQLDDSRKNLKKLTINLRNSPTDSYRNDFHITHDLFPCLEEIELMFDIVKKSKMTGCNCGAAKCKNKLLRNEELEGSSRIMERYRLGRISGLKNLKRFKISVLRTQKLELVGPVRETYHTGKMRTRIPFATAITGRIDVEKVRVIMVEKKRGIDYEWMDIPGTKQSVSLGTYLHEIQELYGLDALRVEGVVNFTCKRCGFCGKFGSKKKCGGCKKVFYCSEKCQRKDWKKHKKKCRK